MNAVASLDEPKQRGAARPAPPYLRALYREAFQTYRLRALWSSREADDPSIADLLAITESPRVEGGVPGHRLPEAIVTGCRAAL